MKICIRVDLKLVNVYYTREIAIEKSCPVPSAPYSVRVIDEERYEKITSHSASRFEDKEKERWFNNYEDAKKYARKLCDEFKGKILRMLERQNIPKSAIKVYYR